MPPPGWQNPITASPGQVQRGVDPLALLPSRVDLHRVRLEYQRQLLLTGIARHSPVQATMDGVIFDGHHAVRAAAEEGRRIDVKVVAFPVAAAADSILDLPVV
jgi:hypothetical protein